MKITLYEFTGSGREDAADYAAGLLIFTKRTRLQMTPGLLAETMALSPEEKRKELEYMANSIASSWEMIDYTFLVEGVTRGYTHQQVRSRHMSFAQQSMRVTPMGDFDYGTGPTIEADDDMEATYDDVMENIADAYKSLIARGASIEDARGVLPTNILTNIIIKMNLRTFVETFRKRSTPRVQSEYRTVLEGMKEEVRRVHPWVSLFIERTADAAARDLIQWIESTPMTKDQKLDAFKLVDLLWQQ